MRDASLNKSECKRMNCMSLHQYFQNRSKSWLFLATLNQRTLFQSGQKQFIEQLQRHPTEYRTLTIFKLKCKNKETCFLFDTSCGTTIQAQNLITFLQSFPHGKRKEKCHIKFEFPQQMLAISSNGSSVGLRESLASTRPFAARFPPKSLP